MRRFLWLLLLIGCATSSRESLLETDRQFAAYSVAHDAPSAFGAFMAHDATLLPNGAAPITGPAIVETLAVLTNGVLRWEPKQADVSGNLGYTWGMYEYRLPNRVSHGKYCTVWRRQPDGSWKFVLDIGNQNTP